MRTLHLTRALALGFALLVGTIAVGSVPAGAWCSPADEDFKSNVPLPDFCQTTTTTTPTTTTTTPTTTTTVAPTTVPETTVPTPTTTTRPPMDILLIAPPVSVYRSVPAPRTPQAEIDFAG